VPRPKTKEQAKRLCSGCRYNRYNMGKGLADRPGVDAPVAVDHCWHLDPGKALYCRGARRWVMPCHSDPREQWYAEWARTGRKPAWRYW